MNKVKSKFQVLFYIVSLFDLLSFNDIKASTSDNDMENSRASGIQSGIQLSQPMRTPLYIDGQQFCEQWAKDKINLKLDHRLVSYIDDIIKRDHIADFTQPRQYSYDESSLFYNNKFPQVQQGKSEINLLETSWKPMLDPLHGNAFANFFLGTLGALLDNQEKVDEDNIEIVRKQLNASSAKLYIRATKFLKNHFRMRFPNIDRVTLENRENILLNPFLTVSNHLYFNNTKGELTEKNLEQYENTLIYLAQNNNEYDQYISIYKNLSTHLISQLTARKRKNTVLRLTEFFALNALLPATQLMVAGVSSIVQGYMATSKTVEQVDKSLGAFQIVAANVGLSAAVTGYPYFYNLIYSYDNYSFNSKLLPSSYSEDEISIQSRFIVLAKLLSPNNELVKELTTNSKTYNYATELRKKILENFLFESHALSEYLTIEKKTDDRNDMIKDRV